jgi:RNA polymerase sigma factor (sigma-70 family)
MDNGRAVSLASDAELWRRAVAGGQAAFGDLFDRHANAIYNFCLRRTGDASTAEDLMSTAFLHAWRRRTDVVLVDDRPLPWLYGIAANLCRRHLRGTGRRRAAMRRLAVPRPEPDPAEDVAHRLDDQRIGERALELLESLPERDQELFVLCVWQGLSYREAALALDIPVGTVRSRLSRARSRLRRLLTEPAPVGGDEWGEQGSERRRKEDAPDG